MGKRGHAPDLRRGQERPPTSQRRRSSRTWAEVLRTPSSAPTAPDDSPNQLIRRLRRLPQVCSLEDRTSVLLFRFTHSPIHQSSDPRVPSSSCFQGSVRTRSPRRLGSLESLAGSVEVDIRASRVTVEEVDHSPADVNREDEGGQAVRGPGRGRSASFSGSEPTGPRSMAPLSLTVFKTDRSVQRQDGLSDTARGPSADTPTQPIASSVLTRNRAAVERYAARELKDRQPDPGRSGAASICSIAFSSRRGPSGRPREVRCA